VGSNWVRRTHLFAFGAPLRHRVAGLVLRIEEL